MRCPECDTSLPTGSRFCTACGDPVSPEAADETDRRLARANLNRVRGEWAAAAEECAAVLRGEPENARARALLGEIYEGQDRLEDAQHWYRAALEADADSETNRQRLARVSARLRASRRQRDTALPGTVGPPPLFREALQRIIVTVGAIVFAILLVARLLGSQAPRSPARTPLPSSARYAAPTPMTVAETQLLSLLTAQLGPTTEGQVRALFLDGGRERATLSLALEPREWTHSGEPAARLAVAREAYRAAYHLHRLTPALQQFTVRVTGALPNSGDESALLFTANLSSAGLVVEPDRITAEELADSMRNPWWNPRLAP